MPKLLPRPLLVALAIGCLGCLTPKLSRTHRDASRVAPKLRTVAVLPTIRVFEVSAGDVHEEHAEWTAQASAHVLGALTKGLQAQGLKAGRPGFRATLSFMDGGLRRQAVLTGMLHDEDLWRVTYVAPARHDFALDLKTFDEALASFKVW